MNATDYETLTQGAGVIELSTWGAIEVTGADRAAFLHHLLSNDITALAPGGSCRAALLTPNAKLIAELVVLAGDRAGTVPAGDRAGTVLAGEEVSAVAGLPTEEVPPAAGLAAADRHWLLTPRACLPALLATLERYLISEAVTLADRTDAWTLLALQGPKTPEVVRGLSGIRVADYPITGDAGVLLMVPASEAAALRETLSSLGAPAVGWETIHVCRVEAGIPWWGVDMDETALLSETGLERRLASFTKGCYVGQEIVARMDTYGSASRKLMRVICEGGVVPVAGDALLKDHEEVGRITSAVVSPSLNRPVALGYVKRPHYDSNTPVTVVCHGRAVSASLR